MVPCGSLSNTNAKVKDISQHKIKNKNTFSLCMMMKIEDGMQKNVFFLFIFYFFNGKDN